MARRFKFDVSASEMAMSAAQRALRSVVPERESSRVDRANEWAWLQAIEDGVAVADAQSHLIVACNATLQQWHEGVQVGAAVAQIFPGFERASWEASLAAQRGYQFEHYFRPNQGRPFNGEIRCRPLNEVHPSSAHWVLHARSLAREYEQEALLQSYRDMLESHRQLLLRQRQRTEAHAQKTRDLLHCVDQGVFTFNLDMTLNPEHSARAESLFQTASFEESTLETVLGVDPDVIAELAEWVQMLAIKRNLAKWWCYRDLAPVRELRRGQGDDQQIISIEFQPVIEDGHLARMMVLGRDVTAQRVAETRLLAEQQRNVQESERILACLNTDPMDVQQLLQVCESLTAQARMAPVPQTERAWCRHAMGRFHTIKGSAGAFGFSRLVMTVHAVESLLDGALKPAAQWAWSDVDWRQALDEVDAECARIAAFSERMHGAARDHVVVEQQGYERLLTLVERADWAEASAQARALNQTEFAVACGKYAQLIRHYRERFGKNLADLQVLTPAVRVDRSMMAALDACLLHVLRNACDHGIESDATRASAGKGLGCISLACTQIGDQWQIEVRDDGQGIDGLAVAARAVARGLVSAQAVQAMSPAERVRLVFLPGLSTCDQVSEMSGRGVGLDVVAQRLEDLGAQVDIETQVGVGTVFQIRLPGAIKGQNLERVGIPCREY